MELPGGDGTGEPSAGAPCDFLVLGGGASGCVLARRLADAGYAVTLVEAGADPLAAEGRGGGGGCGAGGGGELREACLDPLRAAELWGSGGWMGAKGTGGEVQGADSDRLDYAFMTEPEPSAGGRTVPLSAGRALGGGTAINNGLYGVAWAQPRLHPWKEWASPPLNLAAWRPELLAPCVDRAAATLAPRLPPETPRLQAFDEAMAALGDSEEGVGAATRVAWLVDGAGKRVTAASAYLGATAGAAASRPRLRVLVRARAISLEFDEARFGSHGLACRGALVEFRGESPGAAPRRAVLRAGREVLVCCGPILTPVLLMRSGIGPAEELAEASIPVRVASPHVGRNLTTQPTLPLRPATTGRIPAVGPALQPVAPAKAPLGRGLELAIFAWPQLGILYALGLNTPAARGDVRLPLGDVGAEAPPRIRLGLLGHPLDVERMAWGLKRARAVAAHPALREHFAGLEPAWPPGEETLADSAGDARADAGGGAVDCGQWLAERISSTRHPMGTCRMALAIGDGACDERGRVFREGGGVVGGLRVADNSLVPSPPPDSHVMRVAVAIGERMAELVLEDHTAATAGASAL